MSTDAVIWMRGALDIKAQSDGGINLSPTLLLSASTKVILLGSSVASLLAIMV